MTGIEHYSFNPFCFWNPAGTKDGLDDLAHVHHRDEVVITVAHKWKVRKESDAIDPEFTRAGLSTNHAMLAPKRNSSINRGIIGELIKLGDICKGHIRTIMLFYDRPIVGRRDWGEEGKEKRG